MDLKEFFKLTQKRIYLYLGYLLLLYQFFSAIGLFIMPFFGAITTCAGPPSNLICMQFYYVFGKHVYTFLYPENATFLGLPNKAYLLILLYVVLIYLTSNFITYKYKDNKIVYYVALFIPLLLIIYAYISFVWAVLNFEGFGL